MVIVSSLLGIGLLGCLAMYALLNLMAVSGVAICKFFSSLFVKFKSSIYIIYITVPVPILALDRN
jgi:hypothetical protein